MVIQVVDFKKFNADLLGTGCDNHFVALHFQFMDYITEKMDMSRVEDIDKDGFFIVAHKTGNCN
jgi:alkyl hydroperoxide reductase subunit AhpC